MLPVSKLSLLVVATAIGSVPRSVDAHGYVYQPAPTWTGGSPDSGWLTNVDYYWEEVGSGGDQVGIFKTMAEEKGHSVRDVVLDMASDYPCGNTKEDGTQQEIPSDGLLLFTGSRGGGFTHQGPCEIWFDDTLAFRGDNCENEYPGGDVGSTDYSEIPVDYSLCVGDCVLRFYWLAFQNQQWQTYINCIPLKGGSGSSTTVSTTEAPETEAPETEAPATEAPATEAPETSTETESEADTTTTTAPSTSTSTNTDSSSTTTTTTAPSTSTSDDTADTMGTVQPSTSSGSTGWGNWGDWGTWGGNSNGGWSGGWGSRQLRA